MTRLWLVFSLLAGTLGAQDLWVLASGPDAVEAIPLDPPELVPSWRGLYDNGQDRLWVYVTRSPHFFAAPSLFRPLVPTPWVAVFFFPEAWTSVQKEAWFEAWQKDFLRLSTLPNQGVPVSFPAVLRKG